MFSLAWNLPLLCFFPRHDSPSYTGLPELSEQAWLQHWKAIKAVWSSQYNERAVLALKKAGMDHSDLRMAVLCQEVVDAQYAFVAHTQHPLTGNAGCCFAENHV